MAKNLVQGGYLTPAGTLCRRRIGRQTDHLVLNCSAAREQMPLIVGYKKSLGVGEDG